MVLGSQGRLHSLTLNPGWEDKLPCYLPMPTGRLLLIHIYIFIKSGALPGSRLCGYSQVQLPTSKGQLALSPHPQCKPLDYLEGRVRSGLYCSQFQFFPSLWTLQCIKKYIYICFILSRFLKYVFLVDIFRLFCHVPWIGNLLFCNQKFKCRRSFLQVKDALSKFIFTGKKL